MKSVKEIVIPQLAESLVSATVDKWLKQPGDRIEMYEPICELITDKVSAELPSTIAGTLVEILVSSGETVPVGTPVCRVETEVASTEATQPQGTASGSNASASADAGATDEGDQSMRNRFSPAVQQLAAEHGVRLADVTGTGLGGRITRKDILAHVASGATKATSPAGSKPVSPLPSTTVSEVRSSGLHLTESPRTPTVPAQSASIAGRGEDFIDVSPIRNAIARNTMLSVNEIPHGWMMIEVDVTNLVQLRNKVKDEFMKREGINLTYLAFVLKAVVNALKDFPIMNSMWAVDKIIVKRDINISLAVGTEESVATPVIKNADHKTIAGLAREIDDLARRGREGKLTLSDMQGGTFTVNNTGSFGSIITNPIINYPQAAILTFESIVKRPVVINDMIAIRSMANMCLSLDHRVLDGVICGRFLQRVKDNLEGFNLDTKLY
ncbi:dihydrolipoamide acetyltransferase family protein [Paenibacillus glycanilyticus]|uniref:Dihydrolipoamide acetyltransferase component of pyruvate dehydrogenase complex n=1 Tax=Paenibacillus glycanilyticus TaxID=126569 RepID=A0ABQ6GDP6_9BACL|nr:dihydrolipoamide acetyltransferase family protein [Paenibacillus glycanilyticus]GLX69069.1 lipoamide acyltransferase component of branched-chain alpha-keto acid dehydrogenase complex [Paenibacillus glycanilyticus]